jgi:hypothetical protein
LLNGEREEPSGYYVTDNVILLKEKYQCRHCEKNYYKKNAVGNIMKHMLKKHKIKIETEEYNDWMEFLKEYSSRRKPQPVLYSGREKVQKEKAVLTNNATMCNGVIECNLCKTVAADASQMLDHITKEHELVIIPLEEFTEWQAYFKSYSIEEDINCNKTEETKAWEKQCDERAVDYENEEEEGYTDFTEDFEDWLLDKALEKKSTNVCDECDKVFERHEAPMGNSLECFLHERECDGEPTHGIHQCLYCLETFDDPGERDIHEDNCTMEAELYDGHYENIANASMGRYMCTYCRCTFETLKERNEHEERLCVMTKTGAERRMDENDAS